jgi:hypothetical protein
MIRLGILGFIAMVSGFSAVSYAAPVDFPYGNDYTNGATTDIGSTLKQANQGGSILENLLDIFGINYADPNGKGKAIVFIQVVINYVLAIVGFIAVLVLIYAFAKIFTGKEDDEIKKARQTVLWVTIALVVMGISAYIVNFAFFVYNKGI